MSLRKKWTAFLLSYALLFAFAGTLLAQGAEVADGFEFLGVGRSLEPAQVGYSESFIYLLPSQGLRPWVDAFRARGFRSRTTDERFWAERGRLRAEGLVSGHRFFLRLGSAPALATSDDTDLQSLLVWLAHSKDCPVANHPASLPSLPGLVSELERCGWCFADGRSMAIRGTYRLQLEVTDTSVHMSLSQSSPRKGSDPQSEQ